MSRLPYEGIKILDFGQGIAGPGCARCFGDYGAQIIHIESHLWIDLDRVSGAMWGGIRDLNRAWYANNYHACKYSVTLNLRHPNGLRLVKRLISEWKPNVLIESFSPGTIGRLGLDYETVRQLKRDIIFFSTALQGEVGPHKDRMGYGVIATALSGIQSVLGWSDRGPSAFHGSYSDHVAQAVGHALVSAALLRQKRTSRGVYIDLSQQESVIGLLGPLLMDYYVNGHIMQRAGNRVTHASPHGAFPCKGTDAWVAIAVSTDTEWESFCQVLDGPEWTRESNFATLLGRKANEDELEHRVGEWTINFTAEQVETMMQAAGVAASAVNSGKDFMEDPQIGYVNFMREFDHPTIGKIHVYDAPIKLSKCPNGVFRAPLMGEHNHHILRDILGLSDDEIADMIAEKVITTEADLR